MTNNIEDAIKKAVEYSTESYVPDELKEITYRTILSHLLANNFNNAHPTGSNPETQVHSSESSNNFREWERQIIQNLPDASLVAEGNREQQTIWAVITLYSRSEVADVDSVKKIIKDELGITPQSDSNTSYKLKNLVPAHLNRTKDGKGYKYEPTRNSLKIFDSLIENE